jgi:hypothetical protein
MKMMCSSTLTVCEILNVAVTDRVVLMVTLQVELRPVQAPAHPINTAPLAATAVSFTTAPEANKLLHVGWQLIPPGLLVTEPPPVPAKVTVS